MSALGRVREKFGNLQTGTSKSSRSPSAGFAGTSPKESEKFSTLPSDLERRIRAMTDRWQYPPSELDGVLRRARIDPRGWELAVALDEQREAEFRQTGLLLRRNA